MKKKMMGLLLVLALSSGLSGSVFAANVSSTYTAKVYDTEGQGLAMKEAPDLDAQRVTLIPEGESLKIDGVTSSGWGYTNYNGYGGWISLRYTLATDGCTAETPAFGAIEPCYYVVEGTGEEGLKMRTRPSVESSTFGEIPEGKVVLIRAINDGWGYTAYTDHSGWVNLNYLQKWDGEGPYTLRVYDTEGAGLALKEAADLKSQRILVIPEDTELVIDQTDKEGWGHTSYEGYEGWISLRYTKVEGNCAAEIPKSGFGKLKAYRVLGTGEEGLEFRTRPNVESSSFGPMEEGSIVNIQAAMGEWGFACYKGNYGWCSMTYLKAADSITQGN